MLQEVDPARVKLSPGLFQQRFELNRQYLMELKTENLLQNHYFEAGIWGPPAKREDIHWGWEAPNSLVRGHFLGHWISAAARIAYAHGDEQLAAKTNFVVSELARCQEENGGEWVASIPEKYLDRVARGRTTWAAQYVVSKTLMGLWEAYRWLGNEQALDTLVKASAWFHRWTAQFTREQMNDILDFETCGMLEVWADLYGVTKSQEHLDLIERYDRPRLFDRLLAGEDALTNRHANTTIPEALGAARAYEVTGEQRWRDIVEAYWHFAVEARDSFCTGGQTSGENWTPPGRIAARLSDKNQEHCTVYNMMRLAEFLLRWTGDPVYADYRERNLYNGILAQQHPHHGMVTYFLPLRPGSKKDWATRTDSFFCCTGTLVQAHSLHGGGTYYEDEDGLVVTGYVPAEIDWAWRGQPVTVKVGEGVGEDAAGKLPPPGAVDLGRPIPATRPSATDVWLTVDAGAAPVEFTVKLRLPSWTAGPAAVTVNGEPVDTAGAAPGLYVPITRTWEGEAAIQVSLPRRITVVPLPDRPEAVAFVDGPVVLAGLCDEERTLRADPADPARILAPDNELEWDRWQGGYHAVGQDRGLRFLPLHQIVDEQYAVYFPIAPISPISPIAPKA
jgi:DUF1680 family protein